MIVVDVSAVSMSRPDRPLLSDVSVTISTGERIGVVGINGTGKSTLLRVVAGLEAPERGAVRRGAGARIALLDQGGDLPDTTALAAVGEGWEAEAALTRLGLGDSFHRPVRQLSGGQRKRVALARALLEPADLLILDEPTNHLDVDGIEWLETMLARFRGAVLLVTHDRHVLDRVTNRIIELDRGRAHVHQGGYASYLDARAEREQQQARAEDVRRNLARSELAWLRRGAPARTRKPKARIAAATQTVTTRAPAAARAGALDLHIAGTPRLGDTVIELRGVRAGHPDPSAGGEVRTVLDGVDLALDPDERLGVIGLNGAGKSTLLDVLAGRLAPMDGTVVTGPTVRLGYWDQLGQDLDPSLRPVDVVAGPARRPDWSDEAFLERFWFDKDNAWAPVGTLSGGERRRLQLVATLAARPNVLLLDEPTNDLDLDTLRVLEDFLEDWPGALVVVSHDRAFLERTVTDVIVVDGSGRAARRPGGLAGWLADRARTEDMPAGTKPAGTKPAGTKPAGTKPGGTKPAGTKPAGKSSASTLRHRLREADKELASLTRRRDTLNTELEAAGAAADIEALARIGTELAELGAAIDEVEERWLALASEAESG